MASEIQQTPFVKQLAANDRKTRDAALSSLTTYLSSRQRILTPSDLLKLHLALFYTLWHSDRPLPQQSLCSSLSSLLLILPNQTIVPYTRAFWQTMSREWTSIDVLRMEKFLLLTRRFIGSSLEIFKRENWTGEIVEWIVGVWEEYPFNVEDNRIPNGMRFHVIDIYVDELERIGLLEKEGNEEEVKGRKEAVEKLLEPLRKLAKGSPTKAVRRKAKEALGDERLFGNEKVEGGEKVDEELPWGGFDD